MSMIPDETIEQVRESVDLVGIIGEAVELKRRTRGKRPEMTATIGRAIAAALPEQYRGVYG